MRWTVERWLLVLVFIGTVGNSLFGAGVQWAKTASVEATVVAIQTALKQDFVRADVYAADQRRLSEAIERLTRVIEAQPAPTLSPGIRPRTVN